MSKLGLTGVTGNLGGKIARSLSDKGSDLILIARSPERAPQIEEADVRKGSYTCDDETIAALTGVDVLFMVSGREAEHRLDEHKAFIDAAHKAGVRHIVYTSFYNASKNSTFTLGRDHFGTEEYIRNLGFVYTFIRDNFYMDFFVDMMKEYGEIKGPAGDGKVSAVVRSDVAAVIAKVLRNPEEYENQTLNMTGPKEYSLSEMCEIASDILGKEIEFIDETIEEAYESRKAWPAEKWQYDSWVSTYTSIKVGENAGVSTDIKNILGREAIDLEMFLKNLA